MLLMHGLEIILILNALSPYSAVVHQIFLRLRGTLNFFRDFPKDFQMSPLPFGSLVFSSDKAVNEVCALGVGCQACNHYELSISLAACAKRSLRSVIMTEKGEHFTGN